MLHHRPCQHAQVQKTIFNLLQWREGEGGWKWELFNKSSKKLSFRRRRKQCILKTYKNSGPIRVPIQRAKHARLSLWQTASNYFRGNSKSISILFQRLRDTNMFSHQNSYVKLPGVFSINNTLLLLLQNKKSQIICYFRCLES